MLWRIRSERFRRAFAWTVAATVYRPLIALGNGAEAFGAGRSLLRVSQDVYDRFLTRIEQRVTRAEIHTLRDTFAEVRVSEGVPYRHFLCVRGG